MAAIYQSFPSSIEGICGLIPYSNQGDLLNVTPLSFPLQLALDDADEGGFPLTDTKVISFTFAFCRQAPPGAGLRAHIIYLADTNDGGENLSISMTENGYIRIVGRNHAGTFILHVEITNNGGSFADSNGHLIAGIINLEDPTKREIYCTAAGNNNNLSENATWCTWYTYTDDYLQIADVAGDVAYSMRYNIYGSQSDATTWTRTDAGYASTGVPGGTDTLGFFSLDDACSLVTPAVLDSEGWVRDPGKWDGWYHQQPWCFYGSGQHRNTGRTEPLYPEENFLEASHNDNGDYTHQNNQVATACINYGIGSKVKAT